MAPYEGAGNSIHAALWHWMPRRRTPQLGESLTWAVASAFMTDSASCSWYSLPFTWRDHSWAALVDVIVHLSPHQGFVKFEPDKHVQSAAIPMVSEVVSFGCCCRSRYCRRCRYRSCRSVIPPNRRGGDIKFAEVRFPAPTFTDVIMCWSYIFWLRSCIGQDFVFRSKNPI